MIWIVPLLAILAAVDSWNVIWFYFLQMLLYIRFPLMFEWYWDNAGYNGWWGISLVFFLIQFGVLIYLVVSVTKPKSLLKVIL
jgi:hypothetical protein